MHTYSGSPILQWTAMDTEFVCSRGLAASDRACTAAPSGIAAENVRSSLRGFAIRSSARERSLEGRRLQDGADLNEQRRLLRQRQLAHAGGAEEEDRRALAPPAGYHRRRPIQQRPQRLQLDACS